MPGWCRVFVIPAQYRYRHLRYTVQVVTSWVSKWGQSAIRDSRHMAQERATRAPTRISSRKGRGNGTGQLSTTIWRGEITMGIELSRSHLPMAFYSRSHYGGTWTMSDRRVFLATSGRDRQLWVEATHDELWSFQNLLVLVFRLLACAKLMYALKN
jgi:hypothetical protein